MQTITTSQSNSPLVTVSAKRGVWIITAVNSEACTLRLYPGLSLSDARILVPDLKSYEVDLAADRKALEILAASCGRFTPCVATEVNTSGEATGLFLDISGCGHLFGGEDGLLDELKSYLQRLGYENRLAVADTPGAAWGVARFSNGVCTSVEPDGQRAALNPLPVSALRLSSKVIEGLQRLGLQKVYDLSVVPRGPLLARFGDSVLVRLDQAFGRRFETILPQRPTPIYYSRLSFAEPISHRNGIKAALDRLLVSLCEKLTIAHMGVQLTLLKGYRTDGTVTELRIGTARPICNPIYLGHLFREKLDSFSPEYGIDVAVLVAEKTARLTPNQVSMGDTFTGQLNSEIGEKLDCLLDRLDNRIGTSRVLRLQCRARHLPEYATKSIPASKVSTVDGVVDESFVVKSLAARPLRLLSTPEIIQVTALVPEHPPVLFRWHQRSYRVVRAEGPERISPEWWCNNPKKFFKGKNVARDYYRLEDEKGALFWVFRKVFHRQNDAMEWFIHGFFA